MSSESEAAAVKGMIKVVEEMAVHDGPGARAIVFLKGCALRCTWCQNPELIKPHPEVWFKKLLCTECGRCVEVCPTGAIKGIDKDDKWDPEKCNNCGECVRVCPNKAWEMIGHEVTAEELYQSVARYRQFFDKSGRRMLADRTESEPYGKDGAYRGGVTLSGGEPLFQPEFTIAFLKRCKEVGINTTMETCLFAKYDVVWEAVSRCNLLLSDIKHMDEQKHKQGTGVSNEPILENYRKLNRDYEGDIYIRIPLIPGFNDDKENIRRTAEFLYPLEKVKGLDLLGFNTLAVTKYNALGKKWVHEEARRQSDEYLEELRAIVDSYGRFATTIGGMW